MALCTESPPTITPQAKLLPTAKMQALRRSARVLVTARPPIASTSRAFATTVLDSPFDPPTVSPSRTPRTASSKPTKNPFSVPAPVERPKAPRYSAKSSRVTGRTPKKVQKALSSTDLVEGTDGVERSEVGEVKIFLPSVFVRLVRNQGEDADNPYVATFRTDLRLTKPDISNYLRNIYGLSITSIRTMNYLSPLKRNAIGGGYSRSAGTKNYKKVVVTMTEPFWYPKERSREWCNEHFERENMEKMRDRKMLRIGDGQKYGVSSNRYRGAGLPRAEVERLAAIVKAGGSEDVESDGKASQRLPMGLRKKKNVIKRRAEKIGEEKTKVEQEMERLQEAGW